jgi:hypothetical protein
VWARSWALGKVAKRIPGKITWGRVVRLLHTDHSLIYLITLKP